MPLLPFAEHFDESGLGGGLPPGWNAGSPAGGTTAAANGVTPTSSPQMATMSLGSGQTGWITYGTPDGNGGNVTVQCNVNYSGTATGPVGVAARGSSSTLTGSSSSYVAWVHLGSGSGAGAGIDLWNGGSDTPLATVSSATVPSGWKTLTFSLNGPSLSLQVQDYATGQWLHADGTWQPSQATAVTATDSTLSGSGYFGAYATIVPAKTTTAYWDDFYVTPPGGIGFLGWNIARRKPRAAWRAAGGGTGTPLTPGGSSFACPVVRQAQSAPAARRRGSVGLGVFAPLGGANPQVSVLAALRPASSPRRFRNGAVILGRLVPEAGAQTKASWVATIRPASSPRRLPPGAARLGKLVPEAGAQAQASWVATIRPTSSPRRLHGGTARIVVPAPQSTTPPQVGLQTPTRGPARRREPVPHRGSAVVVGWLTPPPPRALTPPSGVARPFARRERPPRRGTVVVTPGRTLGPTVDSAAFYTGLVRPVSRPRPSPRPRGRTNTGGWMTGRTPAQTLPPLFPLGDTRLRPYARREKSPRPTLVIWTGRHVNVGGGLYYNIYTNDASGGPIDYSSPIATVSGTTWTSGPLPVPWDRRFAVRAFNAYGEEQNLDCAVEIIFDAAGNDITNRPLPPVGLRAFATAGGGIRVEWAPGVNTIPARAAAGYNVYVVPGTVMSYASPNATVLANTSLAGAYVCNVQSLANGQAYLVGVRAYNNSGEEPNGNFVTVVADATGPSAVTSLTATAVV